MITAGDFTIVAVTDVIDGFLVVTLVLGICAAIYTFRKLKNDQDDDDE